MSNPTAVVTGAAKRLGREISLALAGKGYDIVIHYNHSSGEAEQLADEIRSKGCQSRLFQADFSDIDSLETTAEKLFEENQEYRILINNASIFNPVSFEETTFDQFRQYFSIHLFYPFFLTKYFSRKAKKGVVVNILDSRIVKDDIEFFPYTLSKKSLASFTRMSARALGPAIRVNGLCPGPVLPPDFEDKSTMEQKVSELPLQKTVAVSDILRALHYLLDNESVTGEFLFVDSGMHLTNI